MGKATQAHTPSASGQPCRCANGTATPEASPALKDITAENSPVISPTRSGKFNFTTPGNSTLPIAMAIDNNTVPNSSPAALSHSERKPSPTSNNSKAPIKTSSTPNRRAKGGAKGENSAKHSTGRLVTKPISEAEMPKSCCTKYTTGPSAIIGARKLAAINTTANTSSSASGVLILGCVCMCLCP